MLVRFLTNQGWNSSSKLVVHYYIAIKLLSTEIDSERPLTVFGLVFPREAYCSVQKFYSKSLQPR